MEAEALQLVIEPKNTIELQHVLDVLYKYGITYAMKNRTAPPKEDIAPEFQLMQQRFRELQSESDREMRIHKPNQVLKRRHVKGPKENTRIREVWNLVPETGVTRGELIIELEEKGWSRSYITAQICNLLNSGYARVA